MSSPTETITPLMDLARDPCISLDSSTKSFFEYDDISISSSVHSMISLETMKKKERKNETKERIRGLMRMKFKVDALQNLQTQEGEGDDFDVGLDESISSHSGLHSCVDSLSLTSAPATKGIMSVRTLEESLRPNKSMSDLRKLRRRVTIKIKSGCDGTASTSRSSPSSTSGNDHNGLTDDTSETSASSSILDDISLGFSKVHIQEYEIVPGCNPSVSEGPPSELGSYSIDVRGILLRRNNLCIIFVERPCCHVCWVINKNNENPTTLLTNCIFLHQFFSRTRMGSYK